MHEALDLALHYAALGVPVGPVAVSWDEKKSGTNKRPLTTHGFQDFTADPAGAEQWFDRAFPRSDEVLAVGLHPGPAGLMVLDVDVKNGARGYEELARLEKQYGQLPDTLRTLTPSGGAYIWLAKGDRYVDNTDLVPGHIDVRADSGFVMAPGTMTPWGAWLMDGAPFDPKGVAPALDWLFEILGGRGDGKAHHGHWEPLDPAALHPADAAALAELKRLGGHGEHVQVRNGQRTIYITRPGKADSTSASIGFIRPGATYVFSSNWPPLKAHSHYSVDELKALPLVTEEAAEPDLDRPPANDVACWAQCASAGGEQEFVVRDLLPRGTVLVLTGEEGDGKTLLAEQLCRQLLRGEDVWGFFSPGDVPITSALFVDTEMTVDDAWPRWKEADERGLAVDPGRLHWLNCGPLDLTTDQDRDYVEAQLIRTGAALLWIDAGGSAVNDPKDDLPVKAFFAWLQKLLRRGSVVAVGLTLHPRKRAQGEYGRRFDDLFGSRDWKGKATKVLYIEGEKVVAWKDRGGHIGRRWPARVHGRFPLATLNRPGLTDPESVPFTVEAKEPEPEFDAAAVREKAIALVLEKPGHYSKTSLSESLGVRKSDARCVIGELLAEGVLGPDRDKAKLSVITGEEKP